MSKYDKMIEATKERRKDCFGKDGYTENGRGRGADLSAKTDGDDRSFKRFFLQESGDTGGDRPGNGTAGGNDRSAQKHPGQSDGQQD